MPWDLDFWDVALWDGAYWDAPDEPVDSAPPTPDHPHYTMGIFEKIIAKLEDIET